MILLRHPTPHVEPGTCYGRTDLDIAPVGHEQIEAAVSATPVFTRIIASPARRCRKLAQSLAEREGLDMVFDERLWEMHMGDWEGLAWKEIDRSASERWLEDPINNRTPNGESFRDVMERVSQCVEELMDGDARTTVVVCHAGPIRAMQMQWHGISFKEAFAQTPPYSEPIRLRHPDWD